MATAPNPKDIILGDDGNVTEYAGGADLAALHKAARQTVPFDIDGEQWTLRLGAITGAHEIAFKKMLRDNDQPERSPMVAFDTFTDEMSMVWYTALLWLARFMEGQAVAFASLLASVNAEDMFGTLHAVAVGAAADDKAEAVDPL